MTKEAMKLALEALENFKNDDIDAVKSFEQCETAITALREALAEQPAQQQEPSHTRPCRSCGGSGERHTGIDEAPTSICKPCNGTGQIATTPPAAPVQQEPVAKMGMYEHKCPNVTGHRGPSFVCQKAGHGVSQNSYCKDCTCPEALNTSPPAQEFVCSTGLCHYRKPLTDEEIWKFWWSRPEVPEGEDDSMEAEFVAAVRAALAAHGIKENT